ncbi:MAG: HAMP domain-containing protein [Gemmatimonadetes bacterium]|nr:HAMP domain-containing protein [Gemmatimonadota bacterium]
MTFATRLFLGAVAILLVSVTAMVVATDRWQRKDLEASLAAELEREASLIASAIPRGSTTLNPLAHRFGAVLGRRVTFIARDGVVLGDSDFDDASLKLLENHRGRPEVETALAGRTGTDRRLSTSTNRPELKIAIPAWPGVVRVSAPLEQVDAQVSVAQQAVLVASLVALLFGSVLAGVGGRAFGRPLAELGRAARALAAGERPDFPHSTAPEIRQLVRSLRAMDDDLGARMEALRRGREETETLIQSMVEGVMAVDGDGNVVSSNDATRRLLAFGPDERIPNARELFHQRDVLDIVERALRGEAVVDRETTIGERVILFTARPLPKGGAVIVLHDVSELKRLETVRRDFVANVSHELKTPLTSIAGYAETLLADETDPATRRKFLDVILANSRRMQRLVDDLLDLARIESDRWQANAGTVDVAQAAREAWAPLAPRAAERNIGLDVSAGPGVSLHAEPDAVRQILTNLFDNSIRHTPPGGRVTLSAQRLPDGMEVVVRDTGAGIPKDHLPRVFERFYRVDPGRSRDEGGTGLGLAIVKHLVEAHDGRVSVESALGEGTTVRLFFPSPIA